MKVFIRPLLVTLLFSLTLHAATPLLPLGSPARKFLLLDQNNQRLGYKDWIGPQAKLAKPMIILSFWSLSCAPCREEMPVLQQYAQSKANQVQLVFINLDDKKQEAAVKERLQQLHITATNLLDPYQVTGKNYNVCTSQGACNVPALYAISAQGTILLAHAGYNGPEALTQQLDQALLQTSTPPPSLDKNVLLLKVHQSAPLDKIANQHGITRTELISILKEAEDAARSAWK